MEYKFKCIKCGRVYETIKRYAEKCPNCGSVHVSPQYDRLQELNKSYAERTGIDPGNEALWVFFKFILFILFGYVIGSIGLSATSLITLKKNIALKYKSYWYAIFASIVSLGIFYLYYFEIKGLYAFINEIYIFLFDLAGIKISLETWEVVVLTLNGVGLLMSIVYFYLLFQSKNKSKEIQSDEGNNV